MISVLIPTLNERRNIIPCLESVCWANEVVVVDSNSTDGTAEAAERYGASVVQFQFNGGCLKKKNWALENFCWSNDWVLVLDADERITPELATEIIETIRHPEADGYLINRRFMFMGKWIRHCGYFPSWNLRLFRHRMGRYEILTGVGARCGDNEIHEHVILQGRMTSLRHEMLHFAYPDIFSWVDKHNRYSNWEAELEVAGPRAQSQNIGKPLARKRRLKTLSRALPFRPALRFLYSYFLKAGFLDGYEGYVLCRLLATYELLSRFKAQEFRCKRELRG
jgi:glycosyltransferase involved in cell wall biosynthesis